jgi:hypothetical protein
MAPQTETSPLDDYSDSPTYKWVIRGLYATALAMNVYVLWEMSAQDYERELVRRKAVELWKRATRPIRLERDWRRLVGSMHWEALHIVEEPNTDG